MVRKKDKGNISTILNKQVSRRTALSTAGKIAVTAVITGVIAGAGGYLAGSAAAPPKTITETVRETVTKTVTKTVTTTAAPPTTTPAKPTIRFEGATVNVACMAGGPEGPHSSVLYYFKDEWEKLTGAKLNVIEIPFAELHEKVITDCVTGAGVYDVAKICATSLGDLVVGGYVECIDDYMKDPRFPKWDPNEVPEPVKRCVTWGGKWYGIPNDCDGIYLYYRRDLWENPDYQKEFKDKYGYDLPDPPKTWDEVRDCAEFFNGWDWDGDGEPEYGLCQSLKVNAQAWFKYLAVAACYSVLPGPVVDRYHNVFHFDPETMEPLINTPGPVKGLEMLIELSKYGPEAMLGWDIGPSWDFFVTKGKAALTWDWGDVPRMAQDPKRSVIKGKLKAAPLPGSYEVWDREHNEWKKFDKPIRCGNILGCDWFYVILKHSKNKEAAYHLCAWLSAPEQLFKTVTVIWGSGVDPGWRCHFPPELSDGWGTGNLKDWVTVGGYDENDAKSFLRAVYEQYYKSDTFLEYLKIPGATELMDSLDVHINEALTGKRTAKEALDLCAKDWERIIEERGKEQMKKWYQESIGYGLPIKISPE